MGDLREWMISMLMLTAACGILEQTVPQGSMKKTVRFVLSLAWMNQLLTPLRLLL